MLKTALDAALSDQEWRGFLQANDFGQVIATGRQRDLPVVTPTHFLFDGEGTVELHVHHLNPLLQAISERKTVMLSVVGADAYIPTAWNAEAGADPLWSPPTSYYAAVQACGEASIVGDAWELAGLLNRQLRHFQPEGGYHPVEPGANAFGRLLPYIRGVRIHIAVVEAKFKFGGNRTPAHRHRVANLLATRATRHDAEARLHVLRRIGGTVQPAAPKPERKPNQ